VVRASGEAVEADQGAGGDGAGLLGGGEETG
jgi:hypothetical protein